MGLFSSCNQSYIYKTTSSSSDLTFLRTKRWRKCQDSNTEGVLRLIIHSRLVSVEKLELHCSGSSRSKFQDKCLFVYFSSVVIQSKSIDTDTEGAVESVSIDRVSVLSGLN